jgi:hypothetical protein
VTKYRIYAAKDLKQNLKHQQTVEETLFTNRKTKDKNAPSN